MSSPTDESQEHNRRGFQLLAEGAYQEARVQFLTVIENNSDWASPYLGLGQTFFFQDSPDLKETTKAFRRAVELKPDWIEGFHWLGIAQEKSGALEDAVKSFRTAIQIDPSDTRPLVMLGVCLTRLGQFRQAADHLRRAIELKPYYGLASAHLFLAEALMGSGQIEAACKEWRLVLSLPPEYPEHNSAREEATKRLQEHYTSQQKRQR